MSNLFQNAISLIQTFKLTSVASMFRFKRKFSGIAKCSLPLVMHFLIAAHLYLVDILMTLNFLAFYFLARFSVLILNLFSFSNEGFCLNHQYVCIFFSCKSGSVLYKIVFSEIWVPSCQSNVNRTSVNSSLTLLILS